MFSLLLRAQKSPVHPHKTAVIKTQTPLKEVSVKIFQRPNCYYILQNMQKNQVLSAEPQDMFEHRS